MRRIATIAACAAAACVLAPAVAPASSSFKFAGRTNQCPSDQGRCGDVTITLATNLRKVTSFFVEFQAKCQNATAPVSDALTARDFAATVAAHTVKFAHDESSSIDLGNGVTGAITASLKGKIRAASGNGSGTMALDVAVKDRSGQQIDTCTTGSVPVQWKVKIV